MVASEEGADGHGGRLGWRGEAGEAGDQRDGDQRVGEYIGPTRWNRNPERGSTQTNEEGVWHSVPRSTLN